MTAAALRSLFVVAAVTPHARPMLLSDPRFVEAYRTAVEELGGVEESVPRAPVSSVRLRAAESCAEEEEWL